MEFPERSNMKAPGDITSPLGPVLTKGHPKGGPLSPLLSNLVLDDFDKELNRSSESGRILQCLTLSNRRGT